MDLEEILDELDKRRKELEDLLEQVALRRQANPPVVADGGEDQE